MKPRRPDCSIADSVCGTSRPTKLRQAGGALRVGQPVGDQRGEIDLVQLFAHRFRRQEIHLDEAAEIVGDAVLVLRDDRGVRDRQAERPPEQRHHRIPVGEAADGRGLGEGGDEAEPRPARLRSALPPQRRRRRARAPRSRRTWCAGARRACSASWASSPAASIAAVAWQRPFAAGGIWPAFMPMCWSRPFSSREAADAGSAQATVEYISINSSA